MEKEGSATLKRTVTPKAWKTSCEFEYGPTSSYGSVSPCPAGIVGSKARPNCVSAELSGLAPDTLYHYRLVAGYAGENNVGMAGPDVCRRRAPDHRRRIALRHRFSEATISAQVNPGGLATTYDVRYGPCPEPVNRPSASGAVPRHARSDAGADSQPQVCRSICVACGPYSVSREDRGEQRDRRWAQAGWRAVFTTFSSTGPSASSLPDDRAYELVSPVTGRNVNVFVPFGIEGGLTSSGGEHGIITTRESKAAADARRRVSGRPPPTGGTGEIQLDRGDDYLATRAAGGGWSAVDVQPPGVSTESSYLAFSSDSPWGSSKPVLSWRRKLRRDTTACIRILPPKARWRLCCSPHDDPFEPHSAGIWQGLRRCFSTHVLRGRKRR